MNRSQLIKEYEGVNRKLERAFMPSIKRAIHAKVIRVSNEIRFSSIDSAIRYLHTDLSNEAMGKAVQRLYTTVGLKHARLNYSRMLNEKGHIVGMQTKGFGFSETWETFIRQYFERFLLEKITFAIAATTRDALLRTLIAAQVAGWGADKTVDALKDWPYERFQAARIVRTEVNRAANVGAKANSSTLSYEQVKEWISAEDWRVRGKNPKDHANHVLLNRQKIDEGDSFKDSVNGDLLDFPGDIRASAASTINCRCHVAYTAKRDQQGNLIPKRRSTSVIFPNQVRRPQIVTI